MRVAAQLSVSLRARGPHNRDEDRSLTSKTLPDISLSAPWVTHREMDAVAEVLSSGHLVQGSRVEALEHRFAALTDTRYAVATSSGTCALHLALLAHDVGPGDEVITSSFSFVATANSILHTGAKPVFVDINKETFNLDPDHVAAAVGPRTKVIMPVHLYGQPCDMDPLMDTATRHGLAVVEDCAQAVGATYRQRPVGSFGTGVFSLYATKNITSVEGGMITTNDARIADRVRILRNQGMAAPYKYVAVGYNFRMTDVHAAIGLAQVDRLREVTSIRQRNAAYLSAAITSVKTPQISPGCEHVWHQFTVRIPGARDQAKLALAQAGVGSGIFYPTPLPDVPHIRDIVPPSDLPTVREIAGEVLSLPVHPLLGDTELERVAAAVNRL